VNPEKERWIFPVLTVKIHLWEMTQNITEEGYFENRHHTLTVLRFHDVIGISMCGFADQNPINGISLALQQRGFLADGSPMTPYIVVSFDDLFQFGAEFKCFRAEVVSAVPCTEEGVPIAK